MENVRCIVVQHVSIGKRCSRAALIEHNIAHHYPHILWIDTPYPSIICVQEAMVNVLARAIELNRERKLTMDM